MESRQKLVDRRFAGMTFVLTGALSHFTQEEAGEMIEQRGGKASASVSKKPPMWWPGKMPVPS